MSFAFMSNSEQPTPPERKTIVCPTCKKPFEYETIPDSMPFCSARCKVIDLGHWINEEIGLPHVSSEEDDVDEPPPVVREWRFD